MEIIYQFILRFMIAVLSALVVAFLLAGGGVCLYSEANKRRKKKKLMKVYDSINIGDVFIMSISSDDPFKPRWGDTVVILDKKINKNGVPYIKYSYSEKSPCINHVPLTTFIGVHNYIPYTGQDKEEL